MRSRVVARPAGSHAARAERKRLAGQTKGSLCDVSAGGSTTGSAHAVCLSLGLATVPAASGEPGSGSGSGRAGCRSPSPARATCDGPGQRAARTARDVSVIKARLLLANQRLEQAGVHAEQASEAYNGALWRLQQARQRAREAQAEAARARRTVAGTARPDRCAGRAVLPAGR